MATYAELLQASVNEILINKIRVAVVVAAEIVRTELVNFPNHTNRMIWAKQVFIDPDIEAKRMVWAVLAQNRGFTYEQIIGADDLTVQDAVNKAVDVFATGV